LRDRNYGDNDRVAYIDILEVYLCTEAVDVLFTIYRDQTESIPLRDRAAKAIKVITGEENLSFSGSTPWQNPPTK
jgi:hypothetical protein